MLLINRTIRILFITLILSTAAFSQTVTEQDSTAKDTTITITGSTVNDTTYVMTKSPMGAVWRSALIPGWGQLYTHSYWKVPIVWGFMGYFTYVWFHQNDLYHKYRDLYQESVDNGAAISRYKSHRNFYRDQRDEFAIYFVLTYFLQLVDAYVDAHMFDFSVEPDPVTSTPQLGVKFHF